MKYKRVYSFARGLSRRVKIVIISNYRLMVLPYKQMRAVIKMDYEQLAELLFPHINKQPDYWEKGNTYTDRFIKLWITSIFGGDE